MSEKISAVNKFEQNDPPACLDTLIIRQQKRREKHIVQRDERLRGYPATIEHYRELEMTSRLSAAMEIFRCETPNKDSTKTMPGNVYRFDISSLINTALDETQSSIAYSEGSWINALNDTHTTKYPHLQININTSMDDVFTNDQLADLEMVKQYNGPVNFQVLSPEWKAEATEDQEDPLFRDVIKIIDIGVESIYNTKLTSLIQRIGSTAIDSIL